MKQRISRIIKIILAILAVIITVALIYVAYVFLSFSRIEDGISLSADVQGTFDENVVSLNEEYSIITYNIGFGAYTSDYSFFMDGGKSSWAVSEDALDSNINSIGNLLASMNPDFAILQEVDTDGTRTYHMNEYERLRSLIGDGNYIFAQNYHSSFLMYPFLEPHGANNSGVVTYISEFSLANSVRRSLPISESVSKIVDLDRCYSITRIPVENGSYLAIYNVHLSAYTNEASVREGQINMLVEDISNDYANGNYVICGGDFNHNLRDVVTENVPGWASAFPRESLPDGFAFAFDVVGNCDINHDSCRNADAPYDPDTAFTVMVDGFIVSPNVSVNAYTNLDYQYAYSDHDPVVMSFELT